MKANVNHKERIIYRCPNKLFITNKRIKVKRKIIRLIDVINHGIVAKRPSRIPALILILVGIIGMSPIQSYYSSYILPANMNLSLMVPGLESTIITFSEQNIIHIIGTVLILSGVLLLLFLRRRYEVIVETERGFQKIADRKKKMNAVEIEMALHEAILYMPPNLFKKAQSKEITPTKTRKRFVANRNMRKIHLGV